MQPLAPDLGLDLAAKVLGLLDGPAKDGGEQPQRRRLEPRDGGVLAQRARHDVAPPGRPGPDGPHPLDLDDGLEAGVLEQAPEPRGLVARPAQDARALHQHGRPLGDGAVGRQGALVAHDGERVVLQLDVAAGLEAPFGRV